MELCTWKGPPDCWNRTLPVDTNLDSVEKLCSIPATSMSLSTVLDQPLTSGAGSDAGITCNPTSTISESGRAILAVGVYGSTGGHAGRAGEGAGGDSGRAGEGDGSAGEHSGRAGEGGDSRVSGCDGDSIGTGVSGGVGDGVSGGVGDSMRTGDSERSGVGPSDWDESGSTATCTHSTQILSLLLSYHYIILSYLFWQYIAAFSLMWLQKPAIFSSSNPKKQWRPPG